MFEGLSKCKFDLSNSLKQDVNAFEKSTVKNTVAVSTPMKVSRFGNCESFLDFHEFFFENLLKIGTVFLAINLQREQNISILTILHLSFLISSMVLLILLFTVKLLARLSIFREIYSWKTN